MDTELLRGLRSDRYDPGAFDRLLEELLALTDDHRERLSIRRGCAGRRFDLAMAHGRGLGELARLFKAADRLGHDTLMGEYLSVALFAKALAERGRPARARETLAAFAPRAERAVAEAREVERSLAEDLRRLGARARPRRSEQTGPGRRRARG